jgi:hypothetical protein
MKYPEFSDFPELGLHLEEYARLKCEQGGSSEQVRKVIEKVRASIRDAMLQIQGIPDDPALLSNEPDDLDEILRLRKDGPRRLWTRLPDIQTLSDKVEGALTARMIGCMLGVPVEGHTVEDMEAWSQYIGKQFPPTDYWEDVSLPHIKNFYGAYRYEYKKENMHSVPIDDDVVYTELSLLIMEKFGTEFTTEDVGKAWRKYLPFACTAEEIALNNLKDGVSIDKAGVTNNPYRQWIGAAIRSDGLCSCRISGKGGKHGVSRCVFKSPA